MRSALMVTTDKHDAWSKLTNGQRYYKLRELHTLYGDLLAERYEALPAEDWDSPGSVGAQQLDEFEEGDRRRRQTRLDLYDALLLSVICVAAVAVTVLSVALP